MCCPASGSAITTSCAAHTPRNDSKSFTKPVKHVVVAQPPRNDKLHEYCLTCYRAFGTFTLILIGTPKLSDIPTCVAQKNEPWDRLDIKTLRFKSYYQLFLMFLQFISSRLNKHF